MDRRNAPPGEEIIPEFLTMAIQDEEKKTTASKVTLPTQDGVTEAREWVEENKK